MEHGVRREAEVEANHVSAQLVVGSIPHSFMNANYKGYLEDRRPNSQGDPYQIASRILKTIVTVPTA